MLPRGAVRRQDRGQTPRCSPAGAVSRLLGCRRLGGLLDRALRLRAFLLSPALVSNRALARLAAAAWRIDDVVVRSFLCSSLVDSEAPPRRAPPPWDRGRYPRWTHRSRWDHYGVAISTQPFACPGWIWPTGSRILRLPVV